MTATNRTLRITRKGTLAGVLATGAALTATLAPHATADDHTTVTKTAEQTSPTAYTPTDHPRTTDDTRNDDAPRDNADNADDNADKPTKPDTKTADTPEPQDQGRGAQYRDDGTLIPIPREDQPKAQPATPDQIDHWIDQALDIMKKNDIPGTYDGIHRNLMRESSGDPLTINMWDTNAHKNIPSKGLLQVIDPTFDQYHVEGTSTDPYDPVANITAAANYAADRYGSMDNVNSAY
ncbi:transglycosylase SLT domain-containing protein [Streptomyces avicenniae]|uniref:transglycosylase SLT domain-containing protein n=1 Tax=Streptomyces avicenniae TaxID=500153 RepID=UPI000AB867B0|nr:transglycosylase SLT domain-containing protein [Streptomyces avicenniae]